MRLCQQTKLLLLEAIRFGRGFDAVLFIKGGRGDRELMRASRSSLSALELLSELGDPLSLLIDEPLLLFQGHGGCGELLCSGLSILRLFIKGGVGSSETVHQRTALLGQCVELISELGDLPPQFKDELLLLCQGLGG